MTKAAVTPRAKRRPTLTKLIDEARAAGLKVGRVEVMPDGRIVLSEAQQAAKSAYDTWKGNA